MKLLFLFLCFASQSFATELVAITVALAPDTKLEEQARVMNSDAVRENPNSYKFDKTHYPHMTLIQGFVEKSDLSAIKKIMEHLSAEKIPVEADGVFMTDIKSLPTNKLFNLRFKKNLELSRLHAKVVAAMKPYLKVRPDRNAFFESKNVQEEFVDYAADHVAKEYEPHMTMGVVHTPGRTKVPEGEKYELEKIEVFQLGEYGTARMKL